MCHKFGRYQHCMASWSLLTNRTKEISHVTQKNFGSKKKLLVALVVQPLNIVIITPHLWIQGGGGGARGP